jgi:proteasome lid subunit RPN8/RPN11
MAKIKKSKKHSGVASMVDDNNLPQNIRLVGEKDVEERKSVYITQSVYKAVHKFAEGKTIVESGGILVGRAIEEFGKTYILVNGFIEAKFTEATSNTLTFTHETWEHFHKEIAKKYPSQKIVGWIHTHPNFGIFLSEYDQFIQSNFFKDENQIAYVVDPIQNIEGFYVWQDEKIIRCKGFFLFDKTGAEIEFDDEPETSNVGGKRRVSTIVLGVVVAILFVGVAALLLQTSNMKVKIDRLEQQQATIVESANQSLIYMQQQITDLQAKLEELKPMPSGEETQDSDTEDMTKPPANSDTQTETESNGGETVENNSNNEGGETGNGN